jgi:hypothetical protein
MIENFVYIFFFDFFGKIFGDGGEIEFNKGFEYKSFDFE